MFDPVFEARCSPFTWLGPKRYTEVPCEIEDIPTIDAVVISHSHYDHLSRTLFLQPRLANADISPDPTSKRIQARHPNAHFFVPLRLKKFFTDSGIENVTELDWWEERDLHLSGQGAKPRVSADTSSAGTGASVEQTVARIGCLPCQHTSARSGFDKGHTLWASWSVESGGKKVWFGGDTGYRAVPELPKDVDDYGTEHNYPHCPAFKQIGDFRGPFDLGLIPIGAYDPRWIMSPMHANPFDSVNIFKDTRCKRAMGIHWVSFGFFLASCTWRPPFGSCPSTASVLTGRVLGHLGPDRRRRARASKVAQDSSREEQHCRGRCLRRVRYRRKSRISLMKTTLWADFCKGTLLNTAPDALGIPSVRAALPVPDTRISIPKQPRSHSYYLSNIECPVALEPRYRADCLYKSVDSLRSMFKSSPPLCVQHFDYCYGVVRFEINKLECCINVYFVTNREA